MAPKCHHKNDFQDDPQNDPKTTPKRPQNDPNNDWITSNPAQPWQLSVAIMQFYAMVPILSIQCSRMRSISGKSMAPNAYLRYLLKQTPNLIEWPEIDRNHEMLM